MKLMGQQSRCDILRARLVGMRPLTERTFAGAPDLQAEELPSSARPTFGGGCSSVLRGRPVLRRVASGTPTSAHSTPTPPLPQLCQPKTPPDIPRHPGKVTETFGKNNDQLKIPHSETTHVRSTNLALRQSHLFAIFVWRQRVDISCTE